MDYLINDIAVIEAAIVFAGMWGIVMCLVIPCAILVSKLSDPS